MDKDTDLLVAVRTALRLERLRRRMSQSEVAVVLGCSRKRLSEFELGQTDPGFSFVFSYATLLGFNIRIDPPENDFVESDSELRSL